MSMSKLKIREATIEDTSEILSCNVEDIEKWRHWNPEKGFQEECSWEELTPLERFMNGGPWLDPQTLKIHFKIVKEANGSIVIAEYNDEIVGEIDYVMDQEDYYNYMSVLWLVTRPKYRRRGIATSLMYHVMRIAKEQKCKRIIIEPEDYRSLNLYTKLGFKKNYELLQVNIGTLPKLKIDAEINIRDWNNPPPSNFREVVGLYYTPRYDWIAYKYSKYMSEIFQDPFWEVHAYDAIIDQKKGIFTDSKMIKIWVHKEDINDFHLLARLISLCILKSSEKQRKKVWTWLKEYQYMNLMKLGFDLRIMSRSQVMTFNLQTEG